MTPMAWATMIAICGLVWGGFVGLLAFALRSEGKKKRAAGSPGRPASEE